MDDEQPVLDTVGGELAFFRSITRFRPVGMHRFFHLLSIQKTIRQDTGVDVPVDLIWAKLDLCYDLDAIEGLEIDGYDSSDSDTSQPHSIPSPVPGENLMGHPHFRSEFQLPWSEYDPLMALRRMSDTSPPASPVLLTRRKTKGKKAQAASERTSSRRGSLMAGLVGGESDSSALTESGEEAMEVDQGSARQSRRNSVMTGTPTEMAEEDGADPAELPASPRGRRGRRRGAPASRRASGAGGRRARRRQVA
ncbi:chromatin modification-related protein EAF7-domain-containing protein [Gautieria morchelliformis]|nr:chromatin modification-related protein EAF7-domain-containing protein [Gautieria morchelliformis]